MNGQDTNGALMVCIHCMTYNQESYIEDALKGFVMQKTDFPFVAVVIDDCSKDSTPEIVRRYADMYPDIIKGVYLTENYYSQGKSKQPFLDPFDSRSRYIAICEGDDFWTDPLKLQKQVDILEQDDSLMGVVTDSSIVDREGRMLNGSYSDRIVPGNAEGRYNLHSYFCTTHHYPTATVMFRNYHAEDVQRMTEHTSNQYLGDWTLWAVLLSFGDFYYLDQVTSAYRINPTSLTHTVDRVGRAKAHFTICKALKEVLPEEYGHYLRRSGWMYFAVFMAYRKEKKYFPAFCYLMFCLLRYPAFTVNKVRSTLRTRELQHKDA